MEEQGVQRLDLHQGVFLKQPGRLIQRLRKLIESIEGNPPISSFVDYYIAEGIGRPLHDSKWGRRLSALPTERGDWMPVTCHSPSKGDHVQKHLPKGTPLVLSWLLVAQVSKK